MKIVIIKEHHIYPLGPNEVTEERGNYLIQMGMAVAYAEKLEKPKAKEKTENKTGNVPTAKKRK